MDFILEKLNENPRASQNNYNYPDLSKTIAD